MDDQVDDLRAPRSRNGQRIPANELNPLERTISSVLQRRRQQSLLRRLTLPSPDSVDFSSNDFLSLSIDPALRAAFLAELQSGNSSSTSLPAGLGSGGSRLLDGNSAYAESLERRIAAFHGAPAGLLCNSGFEGNAGLFASLPQPGDVLLYDELIHASVHEGMRLSRAGHHAKFAHGCLDSFRAVLTECARARPGLALGRQNVFVAVEAVYSMDGDVAPLGGLVEILEEVLPLRNGHLIVDEAHSTGVLGPRGRGLVCALGLESRVAVRLHTFGKSLACTGGMSSDRAGEEAFSWTFFPRLPQC